MKVFTILCAAALSFQLLNGQQAISLLDKDEEYKFNQKGIPASQENFSTVKKTITAQPLLAEYEIHTYLYGHGKPLLPQKTIDNLDNNPHLFIKINLTEYTNLLLYTILAMSARQREIELYLKIDERGYLLIKPPLEQSKDIFNTNNFLERDDRSSLLNMLEQSKVILQAQLEATKPFVKDNIITIPTSSFLHCMQWSTKRVIKQNKGESQLWVKLLGSNRKHIITSSDAIDLILQVASNLKIK